MARYVKSDGFCQFHPERKALENRNICQECHNAYIKEWKAEKRKAKIKAGLIMPQQQRVLSGSNIKKFWRELYDPNSIITKELLFGSTVQIRRK